MEFTFRKEESTVLKLMQKYESYGYIRYKMSKFEEYDFYVRNKDFLTSENIITFTDTNGKLMALKPDVTLSIVKNGKDEKGTVQKVYYSENVYRTTESSGAFKEITQTGLECVGDLDDYCISEVLSLAEESLKEISNEFVLDISHMGILSEIINETGISSECKAELLECVKRKNISGAEEICKANGADIKNVKPLLTLMTYEDKPSVVLPNLKKLTRGTKAEICAQQLENVVAVLGEENIRIDFSVLNDMKYYNGIVFCGFIKGVPNSILSGGQYDLLMKKMGRKSGAIGFAVCPEMLEETVDSAEYDFDEVILYNDNVSITELSKVVKEEIKKGKKAVAVKTIPEKSRYKTLLDLRKGGNANA